MDHSLCKGGLSAEDPASQIAPIWRANTYQQQALEGKNVKDMLLNVGSGGGAAAAPTGGAAGGAAADAPAEEKQEEKKEEGGFHRSNFWASKYANNIVLNRRGVR